MQNKERRWRTPRKRGQRRSNSNVKSWQVRIKISARRVNKGKPNQEAIKSFNKNEGAGQGKGAQGLEAAGGAAGAGAGNKPGNVNERNLQGAGAGKAENQTGNVGEHHGQGTGMGGEEHAQKLGAENTGTNTREKIFTATITTLRETRPAPTTKESNTKARLMGSRR